MGVTPTRALVVCAILGLVLAACAEDPIEPIDPNNAPVSTITGSAIGERFSIIRLDASGSHDPDGDTLTYSWTFVSRPAGSSATISAAGDEASFVPDATGTYVLRLEVFDGEAYATDEHAIAVEIPRLRGGHIITDSIIPNTAAAADEADYIVASLHTLTIDAHVTIEAGVTIRMGEDALIRVTGAGSLSALGIAGLPVRFLGADSVPGYWQGIEIASNTSSNELAFVEVAHADRANVWLEAGTLRLSNSTVRDAQGWGLVAVHNPDTHLPGFASNRFERNGTGAVVVPLRLIGSLDVASDYAGTTGSHVVVTGGVVQDTQTWRSINTSYRFVAFGAGSVIAGAVTIEPGADLVFEHGDYATSLHVSSGGSLSAIGTATDSITFQGASSTRGSWWGLKLYVNSVATLAYVRIGHAGIGVQDDQDPPVRSANIYADGTLTVSNSHLHDSGTYGVVIAHRDLTYDVSNVTYSGNALGDLHRVWESSER